MAPGEQAVAAIPALAPHPSVGHDPATSAARSATADRDAPRRRPTPTATSPFWPEPMIPPPFSYAGCGTCHTHLARPEPGTGPPRATLVERYDCLACHRLDGRGGTLRPGERRHGRPRSFAGRGHRLPSRLVRRTTSAQRQGAPAGPWRDVLRARSPRATARPSTFSCHSRVGAPGLVEAKALFHSLGCRGCHKVSGVGGDDGPDLTRVGRERPRPARFHPRPRRTHARQLAGRALPRPGDGGPRLADADPGSRRGADRPPDLLHALAAAAATCPRPTGRRIGSGPSVRRAGVRHRRRDALRRPSAPPATARPGQGMRYPGMPPFPAIGNPDFLAVASDDFHRRDGAQRASRTPDAGLGREGGRTATGGDHQAVVAHLRDSDGGSDAGRGPETPALGPGRLRGGRPDSSPRTALGCHGPKGEGMEGAGAEQPGASRQRRPTPTWSRPSGAAAAARRCRASPIPPPSTRPWRGPRSSRSSRLHPHLGGEHK